MNNNTYEFVNNISEFVKVIEEHNQKAVTEQNQIIKDLINNEYTSEDVKSMLNYIIECSKEIIEDLEQ